MQVLKASKFSQIQFIHSLVKTYLYYVYLQLNHCHQIRIENITVNARLMRAVRRLFDFSSLR
jgi:hypothetical protein